jgi:hypothetical protein
MPLTASVESGQSSPSCSTGGGITAAVGVGTGAGTCAGGGTIGELTSGLSPGSGVGAADAPAAGLSDAVGSAPEPLDTTISTTAATIPMTTTETPIASALRRQ